MHWTDRRLGAQSQDLAREVGDFILLRADGFLPISWPWSSTTAPRASPTSCGVKTWRTTRLARSGCSGVWDCLSRAISMPLVLNEHGEKLSKQQGAKALDIQQPLEALGLAAQRLGLGIWPAQTLAEWQEEAVRRWQDRHMIRR